MKCRICGKEISEDEKFCSYCGEENKNTQNQRPYDRVIDGIPVYDDDAPLIKVKLQHDNNTAITLGTVGLCLSVIGFIIFGILEFVALGLSIGGVVVANRNKRNGFPNNGALAVSIIGVILSSIGSLIVIIGIILAVSVLA